MAMHEEDGGTLYSCVVCGTGAPALTRTYGPTVLKLATCKYCSNVVDKYIEYDPVIVMIDLILVTREAQRHILHNTKFQTFWKLFVVLALLETYGVWCKSNIINLGVELMCHTHTTNQLQQDCGNGTVASIPLSFDEFWQNGCAVWNKDVQVDDADPFISEKAFYIAFASVCTGTIVFASIIHIFMNLARVFCIGKCVSILSLLKTITLGNMTNLFTLPLLIWGISDAQTKTVHTLLVFAYSFLVFINVLSVMYNFNVYVTTAILILGYSLKFTTVYASNCWLAASLQNTFANIRNKLIFYSPFDTYY